MSATIRAKSQENLSLGVCNLVRLKPAFSATDTSWSLEVLDLASMGIMLSRQ